MESRGQINCYEPYKGYHGIAKVFYTINLATGTTPFMKFIDGIECASTCYRLRKPVIVNVTHAWYRPTKEGFDGLEAWQDHVLNGGLVFDVLDSAIAKQLKDDPVQKEWDYEKFQSFVLNLYGKRLGPISPVG